MLICADTYTHTQLYIHTHTYTKQASHPKVTWHQEAPEHKKCPGMMGWVRRQEEPLGLTVQEEARGMWIWEGSQAALD